MPQPQCLNLLLVEVIPSCVLSACEFVDTEKGRLKNLLRVATKKSWPISSKFLNKVQNPLDSKLLADVQAHIGDADNANMSAENNEEDDYSEIDISIKNQILNALVNRSNCDFSFKTPQAFQLVRVTRELDWFALRR